MDTITTPEPCPDHADLVAAFEGRIVKHKQLVDGRLAIETLRDRSRVKHNKRPKARALLVVGEAGSGKSTILESYYEEVEQSRKDTVDGDVLPVVCVEMPARPTRKQFVTLLLNSIGYRESSDWNTDHIIDRISELFRKLGVELVLVDEAHHLALVKSKEAQDEISEFIKSLLNRSGVQFVFFGLTEMLSLTASTQLKRRLQPSVILSPYRWDTLEGRTEFRVVIKHLEGGLKTLSPGKLYEMDPAVRLYCATGGHVGLVSKFLSEAYRRALLKGSETVDLALLGEVYASFERDAVEFELSDDWQKDPSVLPVPTMLKEDNPFLADKADFDSLWTLMKARRASMAEKANRRPPPRATGLIGKGNPPKAFPTH